MRNKCECDQKAKQNVNQCPREIEVFLTTQGKFVSMTITNEEMESLRKKMESPAPNFLTISDNEGHVHVFNSGEILAITRPERHTLKDESSVMQFALAMHDKELITETELREMIGLPPRSSKKTTVGLGNK